MQLAKGKFGKIADNNVATPHGSDKNATEEWEGRRTRFRMLQLPTGQIKMQLENGIRTEEVITSVATPHGSDKNATQVHLAQVKVRYC